MRYLQYVVYLFGGYVLYRVLSSSRKLARYLFVKSDLLFKCYLNLHLQMCWLDFITEEVKYLDNGGFRWCNSGNQSLREHQWKCQKQILNVMNQKMISRLRQVIGHSKILACCHSELKMTESLKKQLSHKQTETFGQSADGDSLLLSFIPRCCLYIRAPWNFHRLFTNMWRVVKDARRYQLCICVFIILWYDMWTRAAAILHWVMWCSQYTLTICS